MEALRCCQLQLNPERWSSETHSPEPRRANHGRSSWMLERKERRRSQVCVCRTFRHQMNLKATDTQALCCRHRKIHFSLNFKGDAETTDTPRPSLTPPTSSCYSGGEEIEVFLTFLASFVLTGADDTFTCVNDSPERLHAALLGLQG